ncbi:MAG: putative glycoside hydrolase [Patescibacteria group bacterium]
MQKVLSPRRIVFIVLLILVGVLLFAAPRLFSSTYMNGDLVGRGETLKTPPPKPDVIHLETPEPLKAIYMTQCVVGTPSFREKLVKLIDETELNAVIIDIKDFSGRIAFTTDNEILANAVSDTCGAYDMKEFIKTLHEKNIYVIGRITVFQDPHYSKLHPELAVKKASDGSTWKDNKGLSFIDVGAEPFWDYIIELSEESYVLGFDELNFDYVRYPSDGPMKDIAFTWSEGKNKEERLEDFFAYLYDHLSKPTRGFDTAPKLSVDLFGYTTTNTDDLGIGQVLERALPYFHYVMPMVYPSHYNDGFIGIADPAAHPYEVIEYSMREAARRARVVAASVVSPATTTDIIFLKAQAEKGHGDIKESQLRPWIQDFDLGATYTPEMVRAEIQATYDVGLTSWALWDAGNTYTRGALLNE